LQDKHVGGREREKEREKERKTERESKKKRKKGDIVFELITAERLT